MHLKRTGTSLPVLLTLLIAMTPVLIARATRGPQATVTVSGTITHEAQPVAGVGVTLNWGTGGTDVTTDASGAYSLGGIPVGNWLNVHVRPPVSMRLEYRNWGTDSVTANLTKDFELQDGHLLDGAFYAPGGGPFTGEGWVGMVPYTTRVPESEWMGDAIDGDAGAFRVVLRPDVYALDYDLSPYHRTPTAVDLRSADVIGLRVVLSTVGRNPFDYDPPDTSRITIGSPDSLGEAAVAGAPGAVLPLAHVLLVNLNSNHQVHTISDAEGRFDARIYAPPGSAIMVKHGLGSERWRALDAGVSEGLNPYPGTILHVPHTQAGNPPPGNVPFAAAGAIDSFVDDPDATRNYVGSAWAITGTLGPVLVDGEWTRVLTGTYGGGATPGLYLGGLTWTHPALGDLDDDGDLDLLVGERSGRLVLYRNNATAPGTTLRGATSPAWQFEAYGYAGVDTGEWAYPALVDVTGDGALDLFVGAGGGTVSVYYNDGTAAAPLWPDSPDVSLSAGYNAAPTLIDLDNDLDLDLLVGHEGSTLYAYRNTGTPTSPAWSLLTETYGGISEPGNWGLQPSALDLDGDDDLDLLIGRCGDLVWYRNNGPPSNPTWTRVTDGYAGIGGSCGVSPGLGDWDGDTDTDLVIGHHLGRLGLHRNEGPPAAPVWTPLGDDLFPFDFYAESAPAAADLDADDDLDLLVGQLWGELYQVRNDGTSTEPDWSVQRVTLTLPWIDHPHAFPALADIDGDDDPDLFIGEGGWQGPGAGGNIHYYRNDGGPSSPSWTQVTTSYLGIDVGGWSTPAFADIDDDHDLDLFVGDEAGTMTFIENTGTITAPAWASPVHPYAGLHLGEYSAPAFLDVDEDGDLDMLVGQGNGALAYVLNQATVGGPSWELVTRRYPGIDIGDHATPTAADLNGDGKPDLLIGDGDGGLDLYLYEGPGTPPTPDDRFAPGDLFQAKGTMRLYSPAITATTDLETISIGANSDLVTLFNEAGQPMAMENYFMSTLLTPSGFPIQRNDRSTVPLRAAFRVEDLRYAGGHAIEGEFTLSGRLPADLPPGIYSPLISLDFSGVPTSTDWLAANVVRHTVHPNEAALPPVTVGDVDPPRLVWRLLTDDFVQGTRGTGAREDRGTFELASQIVSQGAPYYTPAVDVRSGEPITYRLEPYLPMVSFTDRRMPAPPLIPFDLPGGQLCVAIQAPDGIARDLGCDAFAQSFNRTKTTRAGRDLNVGTVQLDDVYSLRTTSDRFQVAFDQYGHHVITMTGTVQDVWGNAYAGGGSYDLWIAHPLDIDPGVLPGTPLAVGDAFNPSVHLYPHVPAEVTLTVTLYPDSDPTQAIARTLTGRANPYGAFSPVAAPITLTHPGEVRVDLTALYSDTTGAVYMGAMTWGGVVMTPERDADLIAHGRRGLDSLEYIPNHWFVAARDLTIPEGAVSHALNPYYNGDLLWSRISDEATGGNSLVMGASVQDTVGSIEAAVRARAERSFLPLASPGDLDERFSKNEIPLFSSTRSGRPAQLVLGQIGAAIPGDVDQIAYSYRSSQRPGVRVREVVAEDGQSGGYWRLDTLYDDQLGVGIQGDQVNDYKFQYVGAVYRDLDTGHNEYVGQGSGWVFIPDDDPDGNRVMPPFAGPGNGGWPIEGGPILTLKGEDIHLFILPTGTRPGAMLQTGDVFRFAGHILPTLDSSVAVTLTAPGGTPYLGGGRANSVGYFYNPEDDLTVDKPGMWSVDVRVWHEGQCSGGTTVPPYPSGDVLGSDEGRYFFYVVPSEGPRLNVSSPSPGTLSFGRTVTPIPITGAVPAGLNDARVDYTIRMAGYILEQGHVMAGGGSYQVMFDPAALHQEFPNLDLIGRDDWHAGLADTFAIGLLLSGDSGSGTVYRANTITIQGEQVYVGGMSSDLRTETHLPIVLRGR